MPIGLAETMATLREQQKIARAQQDATTVNNVTVITPPMYGWNLEARKPGMRSRERLGEQALFLHRKYRILRLLARMLMVGIAWHKAEVEV